MVKGYIAVVSLDMTTLTPKKIQNLHPSLCVYCSTHVDHHVQTFGKSKT